MAEGLEDSRFTSVYDRIQAREAREKQTALAEVGDGMHLLAAFRKCTTPALGKCTTLRRFAN